MQGLASTKLEEKTSDWSANVALGDTSSSEQTAM
jgi:hypothetical protein